MTQLYSSDYLSGFERAMHLVLGIIGTNGTNVTTTMLALNSIYKTLIPKDRWIRIFYYEKMPGIFDPLPDWPEKNHVVELILQDNRIAAGSWNKDASGKITWSTPNKKLLAPLYWREVQRGE